MMVVAKKKSGLLLLYGIILLFGLVIIVAAFTKEFEAHYLIAILFAIVIIALFSYNIVKYLRVPYEIITVDNKGMLHLPKDVTLDPKDIIDVSYRCARGKGITIIGAKLRSSPTSKASNSITSMTARMFQKN